MGRTFTSQVRTWDESGRERTERGRGWKVIRAEPLVTTLFTPSRGLERLCGFRDPSLTLRRTTEGTLRMTGVGQSAGGVEFGGGAWKTRGRPWPRERVDGACARRDGAKRKVFQVPPPNYGRDGLLFIEAVGDGD